MFITVEIPLIIEISTKLIKRDEKYDVYLSYCSKEHSFEMPHFPSQKFKKKKYIYETNILVFRTIKKPL